MTAEEVSQYTASELSEYLKRRLEDTDTVDRVTSCLDFHKINGLLFLTLNPEELQELVPVIGDRKMVKDIIDEIKESSTIKTTARLGSVGSKITGNDSNWISKYRTPQFSRKTEDCILKSQVTRSTRTEIIAAMAWEVWKYTQYPTADDYNAICKLLVQKHPTLKDTIGNGYGSWKTQLRQKLKNMRRPSNDGGQKRARTQDEVSISDDETPVAKRRKSGGNSEFEPSAEEVDDLEQLEQTFRQEANPSKTYIKKAMKATFKTRRKWIVENCPSVLEVLEKYPVFKEDKHIKREAIRVFKENSIIHDLDDTRNRMDLLNRQISAQALLESRSSKKIQDTIESLQMEEEDQNIQDENAVELLGSLLKPKAKEKILHKLSEDMSLQDNLQRLKQNEPYIFKATDTQYFIVIERQITVELTNFLDAVTSLICTYFVYDISYSKALTPILIFIQRYFLGIKDNQTVPSCVTRLLASLDQHIDQELD